MGAKTKGQTVLEYKANLKRNQTQMARCTEHMTRMDRDRMIRRVWKNWRTRGRRGPFLLLKSSDCRGGCQFRKLPFQEMRISVEGKKNQVMKHTKKIVAETPQNEEESKQALERDKENKPR